MTLIEREDLIHDERVSSADPDPVVNGLRRLGVPPLDTISHIQSIPGLAQA
jgi:hypothetical protein